jgi:uncharacterized protein YdiU (UPF0061 family)
MLAPSTQHPIFPFDNSYARLPERFYARQPPAPVPAPRLIRLNEKLALELGLDPARLATPEGVAILAGNAVPDLAEPLAMAYAGHQFGMFTPQLGDGRALLLGEIIDPEGVRRDIHLKGSGRTPFSRNGDGLAALGPVLREYLISEAMHAFGIPTTRSLAAVATGATVRRDRLLPGAVLTRVAASHVRIGTFQLLASRGDTDGVRQLADYVIARHYPEAAGAEQPYLALFDIVVTRQAELIAQWMLVGFIHGVMNTDNMQLAGETIDFGPCAFMDAYNPAQVYSSIDYDGRYAYANQPRIGQWNLARLAETLLPLLADERESAADMANEVLRQFSDRFEAAYFTGMRRKLGLMELHQDDRALAQDLLDRMAGNGADFTLTFRRLADAAVSAEADAGVRSLFADAAAYDDWATRWRRRLTHDSATTGEQRAAAMRAASPAFIPRNHLVEEALAAAVDSGDLGPFETLLSVVSRPYDDQPALARYTEPPAPEQIVRATFCGT